MFCFIRPIEWRLIAALQPDLPIQYDYIAGRFTGNTSQAVAFYYDPPACLRLLEADIDLNNRFIPDESLMREASALSNPTRSLIHRGRDARVYGPEPPMVGAIISRRRTLRANSAIGNRSLRWEMQAFKLDDHPNNPC
jgi:hypothetical protein